MSWDRHTENKAVKPCSRLSSSPFNFKMFKSILTRKNTTRSFSTALALFYPSWTKHFITIHISVYSASSFRFPTFPSEFLNVHIQCIMFKSNSSLPLFNRHNSIKEQRTDPGNNWNREKHISYKKKTTDWQNHWTALKAKPTFPFFFKNHKNKIL